VISKDRFDDEATAFLTEFYPEALTTPMPLPVEAVAENMGLAIKRISITRNLTLFGMMIFTDTFVQFYDREEQLSKITGVEKGDIVVDPNVCFMRNIGCERNTIIHECVHWHKHRKYHELAKLYDPDSKLVVCRVSERETGATWANEDWMEWQANGIAPRILMPRDMAKLKIDEYQREYEEAFPKAQPMETTDYVIQSLAAFFNVSKAAAKFRMLDLGYSEAAGLYVYLEDHYLSPFAFPQESNMGDHSYSIGMP
jgi:ribosomal protein S24E